LASRADLLCGKSRSENGEDDDQRARNVKRQKDRKDPTQGDPDLGERERRAPPSRSEFCH
jgi:hypothetical protein